MSWYYGYDDNDYDDDDETLSDYETPSRALVIEGPIHAESRRGEIGREWWGQQWVQALERLGMSGRLERGKRYARNGSVLRLEITEGLAYAEVQGSRRKPYRTAVHLKVLMTEQWEQAFDALSQQAIYMAKLLAGEMPADIEAIFQHVGLSLFPQTPRDIGFTCSCPDWGNPCKHAAAVYYLIAEQLDADPFVLFHLRGRHREAFEQVLQGYHVGETTPDEVIQPERAVTVEGFWEASDVHLVRKMPVQNIEPIALRQLGNPPVGVDKELRRIYANVSREAVRWLGLDDS